MTQVPLYRFPKHLRFKNQSNFEKQAFKTCMSSLKQGAGGNPKGAWLFMHFDIHDDVAKASYPGVCKSMQVVRFLG